MTMTPLTEINKQDGAPELRRRARLLYGVLIFAFLGLVTRLVYLQLIQGERYTFLSENNRVRIKRVPGTRGMILDRQGQLLVDSRPSFDLIFVPEDTGDPESTLRLLASYIKSDETEFLKIYEQNKSRAAFDEMVLGRDVGQDLAQLDVVDAVPRRVGRREERERARGSPVDIGAVRRRPAGGQS